MWFGDLMFWGFLGLLGLSDTSTALHTWAKELDLRGFGHKAPSTVPLISVLTDCCLEEIILPSSWGLCATTSNPLTSETCVPSHGKLILAFPAKSCAAFALSNGALVCLHKGLFSPEPPKVGGRSCRNSGNSGWQVGQLCKGQKAL